MKPFYLKLFCTPDASLFYIDFHHDHIAIEIMGFMFGVEF